MAAANTAAPEPLATVLAIKLVVEHAESDALIARMVSELVEDYRTPDGPIEARIFVDLLHKHGGTVSL